ncbi:MAG TPA: isoprenylcysteine carboxylmethyltransferase family protein [Vicinamibacterales bacterium]|nr:isoprenylcysteine carboxylmethyltransferase family protein [Vicinamibacterales bacterium]
MGNAAASEGNLGASGWVRAGDWLFRRRSWLPLPIVVALLAVTWHASRDIRLIGVAGPVLVAAAEGLRLWAVRHIGVISRTRSGRTGALVASGPFVLVRNPLYVGNIGIWLGFTVSAGLLWMAPLVFALLALEYHAIVRWEETLLATRMGSDYQEYSRRVGRWWPAPGRLGEALSARPAYSWRDTLFSERGTLLAIGGGYVLLAVKAWLMAGGR